MRKSSHSSFKLLLQDRLTTRMATRVMTAKPKAAGIATSFVEWSPGGTPHALSVIFVDADASSASDEHK
jgi:hypothetical protein